MHASIPPHCAALAHHLVTLCLAASSLLLACGDDTRPNTTTTDTNNAATDGAATNNAALPDPPTAWRYVLIEDQESPVAGEFPGADIDAVELITADGVSHFATTVEDFNFGRSSATDPAQVLGDWDAQCDVNSGKFASLGGANADGYVIVGFSTPDEDITFNTGAMILVYEVGGSMCGNGAEGIYAVSISTSVLRDTFVHINTGGGLRAIPVTIDP